MDLENLDLRNITPYSPPLYLGLIDNITNIYSYVTSSLSLDTTYIYTCKLQSIFAMLQMYTQLVVRSTENEKQIVFDNLASFRKK